MENTCNQKKFVVGEIIKRSLKCRDMYNNTILNEEDYSSFKVDIKDSKSNTKLKSKDYSYNIKSNKNGSYEVSFTLNKEGKYQQQVVINEKTSNDKFEFEFLALVCSAPTPLLCPNINKCVKDYSECLNKNDFSCYEKDSSKPFYCQSNKTCVASQSDCKPGENYTKCENSANFIWVPNDKVSELCPNILKLDCSKISDKYKFMCPEGNCVPDESYCASRRVCPIGKVLCADLTCRNSYEQCPEIKKTCSSNEIICSDLTCTYDQKNCPTQITCPIKGDVVCPDGSCVSNEMKCKNLPICPEETPYLCSNNRCVKTRESCTKQLSCGHGMVFCSGRFSCQSDKCQ
jgi:hypothetical protein